MGVYIAKVGVAHVAYYMGGGGGSAGAGGGAGGSPVVGYYTGSKGDLPGVWTAAGGMGVKQGSPVTAADLTASLSALDPATGRQLGRRTQPGSFTDAHGVVRPRRECTAFDLVFAPPKEISGAWALADPLTRAQIEAAFDRSVTALVDYMQTEAVASRAGAGGTRRVEAPAGATVARFDHLTSRAGDPHMHAHLLFHNRVLCEDGKWRTLDGRLLYRHAAAASAYAAAVLRAELSQRLGWTWDRVGGNWHADLAGSPRPLLNAWSSRHRQIAAAAGKKVRDFEQKTKREPTPEERKRLWQEAWADTRPGKQDDPDPHARWRREAEALGVDPDRQMETYRTADRTPPGRYDRAEHLLDPGGEPPPDQTIQQVLAQIESDNNAARGLTRANILRHIYATINADRRLHGQETNTVEAVQTLAAGMWERITSRLIEREGRWYSEGLAGAETAAVSWLASPASPASAEANLDGLGEDQTRAAAGILNADTRGVLVVGPAGTGKTKMLERVAAAVGPENVLAVAPTAAAALNLGEALGVPAETAARAVLDPARTPQDGWVIVDEAGQMDTRTLAALAGRAAAAGGRMVLVGDAAQQGPVSAGGIFQALADSELLPTVFLSELWRFEDLEEARATVEIRHGRRHGLDYHHRRGRIQEGTSSEAAEHAARWWAERRRLTTVITAPTLHLCQEINLEIAALRRREGETGDPVLGEGIGTIRKGDVIATRRNNRRITASDGHWIRNGDRWTVIGEGPAGAVTAQRLDGSATVTLPADYAAQHVTLGYATTTTRAQSITVDAALCAVTAHTRRDQLYVGLTRGRKENHLLVVTDLPQHDPDTPPDHLPADTIIQNALDRTTPQPLSIPAGAINTGGAEGGRHLDLIARTPNTAPLPRLKGYGLAERVGTETPQYTSGRSEEIVGDAIEDWLDYATDEEARRADVEFIERIEAGDIPPDDAPWPEHSAPEPGGGDPPPDWAAPPPGRNSAGPRTPAQETAITGIINDWEADRHQPFLDALQTINTPAPDPRHDNGPLVDLTALYQAAVHNNDQQTADRTAGLIAAAADPTLRRMLEPHIHYNLTPDEHQWAQHARAVVKARRAARWAPHAAALGNIRRQMRRRMPPEAAAADRTAWNTLWEQWLNDGAAKARIPAVWHNANRAAAEAAAGINAETPPHNNEQLPDPNTHINLPEGLTPRPGPPRNRRPAGEPAADGSNPERDALRYAADWYHQQLLNHPEAAPAREYLHNRGITPQDWTKWKIGWAPSGWRTLCDTLQDDPTALAAGLASHSRKTGRAYDAIRRRVMFPIRDLHGSVIGFAGRKLPGDPQPSKYRNTRTTNLYNKSDTLYGIHEAAESIQHTRTAAVVEGYTDAIAAHAAGLTNVVATGGTAFTDSHLQRILTAGAQQLTTAFDGDPAGRVAAQRVLDQARPHIPAADITFPAGTDPADLTPEELHHHWNNQLPQPWADLASHHQPNQDLYTRIRSQQQLADRYTQADPIIKAIAAHQTLNHTTGATPTALTSWNIHITDPDTPPPPQEEHTPHHTTPRPALPAIN